MVPVSMQRWLLSKNSIITIVMTVFLTVNKSRFRRTQTNIRSLCNCSVIWLCSQKKELRHRVWKDLQPSAMSLNMRWKWNQSLKQSKR